MPKHNKTNSDMTGTTSLDLPPALQRLFQMDAPQSDGQLPSYFIGGLVNRAGAPEEPGEGFYSGLIRNTNTQNPGQSGWNFRGMYVPPPAFDMGMAESSQQYYDPMVSSLDPGPSAGLEPAQTSGGLAVPGSWMPGVNTIHARMQGPGQFQSLRDIPGAGTISRVAQGVGSIGRGMLGLVPGGNAVRNWMNGTSGSFGVAPTPDESTLGIAAGPAPALTFGGTNESPAGTPTRASGSYRSRAGNVVGHVDGSMLNDASMNPGMTPMMEHAAQQFREQSSITERAQGGPIHPGQTYSVAEIEPEVVDTPQGSQVFTEPTVIQPTQPGYVNPGPKGQQMNAMGLGASGQQAEPMAPEMLEMHVNQFAQQHPEQMRQVQAAIKEAMSSGEMTPQELNTIVQLATVAAQNPAMYPHVRQYAIQQGIAGESDISPQYDQGLVFALLIAGRAVQQMSGTGQPQIPSMKKGGALPSVGDNRSMVIEAHDGEYVVPKHVVDMKGREFFDNLVKKYEGGGAE